MLLGLAGEVGVLVPASDVLLPGGDDVVLPASDVVVALVVAAVVRLPTVMAEVVGSGPVEVTPLHPAITTLTAIASVARVLHPGDAIVGAFLPECRVLVPA